MIQQGTMMQVIDNSGAKTVKCIKVLGGYKKKYATLGDVVVISVQELRNKSKITSKVKKGEIYRALVLRIKRKITRKDGTTMFCHKKAQNNNSVTIINKKRTPLATRLTEPVLFELKKKQFMKFTNLSTGLL